MSYYRHITDYCGQEQIGVHGLSDTEIAGLLVSLQKGLSSLKAREHRQATPVINLASKHDDIDGLLALAETIRRRFNHVVVVGAGGSGLSAKALLTFSPCLAPSFDFLDNIDPDMFAQLLARIDTASTCFIIISKSGTTVETLAQAYALVDYMKQQHGRSSIAAQFIILTEQEQVAGQNPMRELAAEYDMRILDFPADIGGRFSILTNVGLLPAAIAGIDIRGLREGAQSVVDALDKADSPAEFAPAIGAAMQYGFYQRSRNISVMLPYSERLAGFSFWYRQGWAESLGKDGKGSTPIRAVGTTDQHSQLQLYLNGPKDKLFHLITIKRDGTGPEIHTPPREDLHYMQGKTLGDIMAAQQRATFETLVRNRCPVRLFELDQLTEREFGALIMHFTLEILFMSFLLEVNPFDQPAVEESKELARQYLLGNL